MSPPPIPHKKLEAMALLKLIAVVLALSVGAVSARTCSKYTTFILFGATGDLSKKYLWQSLFDMDTADGDGLARMTGARRQAFDETRCIKAVAVSRESLPEGRNKVLAIIDSSVKCTIDVLDCAERKKAFLESVAYASISDKDGLKKLCSKDLPEMFTPDSPEVTRVFYAAVPPKAFGYIVEGISEYCSKDRVAPLLVLEKPFGVDLQSAQELARSISAALPPNSVLLIDHYSGKSGARKILQFRQQHRQLLDGFWNRQYIERIEVVVKEEIDCEGRTEYYDKSGVLKDMFQNHLTDVLARVMVPLAGESMTGAEYARSKEQLLGSLRFPSDSYVHLGQYMSYIRHLRKDTGGRIVTSTTATFAAVLAYVDLPEWYGVPILLVSGKQLDERSAYARIVFRSTSCQLTKGALCGGKDERESITFHIQGGGLKRPAVILPAELVHALPNRDEWDVLGSELDNGNKVLSPAQDSHAYTVILGHIIHEVPGYRLLFESMNASIASWKAWSGTLNRSAKIVPVLYDSNSLGLMRFCVRDGRLVYPCQQSLGAYIDLVNEDRRHHHYHDPHGSTEYQSSLFRGRPLVTACAAHVTYKLVNDILRKGLDVQSTRPFHLFLSGGSTAVALFSELSMITGDFWAKTHLWLVDERCVAVDDVSSNFGSIQQQLLNRIPIPYSHVHPMMAPRRKSQWCSNDDIELYKQDMGTLLHEGRPDYIVLGLGEDGHTASLFSNDPSITSDLSPVRWVRGPTGSKPRMTLSLAFINSARVISFHVLGYRKSMIVRKVYSHAQTTLDLPATLIQPVQGQLAWYIDHEALN